VARPSTWGLGCAWAFWRGLPRGVAGVVQRNRLAWPHHRRGLASDGVRYAGVRSSVGHRFRSATKLRLEWYGGVFLLLQQRSKHPREMVITSKASTSHFIVNISPSPVISSSPTNAEVEGATTNSEVKGALCAEVIRLRVSYNQNDETLGRNSLRYRSRANLPILVHQ